MKKHLFSALDPVMAYEVGKLRPISFAMAIQDARQMEVLKNRLHNSQGLAQPKQPDNMAPPSQRSVPYEVLAIQSAEDSLEMMNCNFKSLKIHLAQHPQQVDPRCNNQQQERPPFFSHQGYPLPGYIQHYQPHGPQHYGYPPPLSTRLSTARI